MRRGLPAQRGIERRHGAADLLRVPGRVGPFERAGSVQHHAIVLAQRRIGHLALGRLALECLVDRLAKRVPQLLLLAPVDRDRLRLGLPALLQGLHRIDTQFREGAQHLGLVDHCLTPHQAGLLHRLERRRRTGDRRLPQRLQLREHLFADMPAVAPAVAELVQHPIKAAPVVVQRRRVGSAPGLDLVDQCQPLRAVFGRLRLHLLQPGLHHLVRLVAGFVETLPHRVVRNTALVGLLPLLAQRTQRLLHLAATDGLPGRTGQQTLGLGHQFLAQLIGAPALPSFQLAGRRQGRVCLVFQAVIDDSAEFFQCIAQRSRCASARLAMPLGNLLFQLRQRVADLGVCLLAKLRVNPGFLRFGQRFDGESAGLAQLVGPHRNRGQRRRRVRGRSDRLGQGTLKRVPNHQQLPARGLQQRGELQVDAGPVGVGLQFCRLRLPVRNVSAQRLPDGLGGLPGFGRQHLDALGQQHGCFTLYLHAVLQVLDHLDPVCQLTLDCQQRLLAKGRSGFCRIALPGQRVGDVELGNRQQTLGLAQPFRRHQFLPLGAPYFIEPFSHRPSGALVARTKLAKDLLQLLLGRIPCQPCAHTGCAFAGCGC